jgi:DNA-binding HxlR family transcriptional regulator
MKNQTIGVSDIDIRSDVGKIEQGPCTPEAHRRFQAALRLLTGRWKMEIMWELRQNKRRFGELRRAIPGITQHMLTTQLRDLEAHGLVRRTIYAEVPPKVEYESTPAACALRPVFGALYDWCTVHANALNLDMAIEEGDPASEGVSTGAPAVTT